MQNIFVLLSLIIIFLLLLLISKFGSFFLPSSLTKYSLMDAGLLLIAVYAVWKKPWGENLAVHFKKAYKTLLDYIEKTVKERDELREECNTLTFIYMTYETIEDAADTMRSQDGYPYISDMGKREWELNKEKLLDGLSEIEKIRNSEDAAKILSNYSSMMRISNELLMEVIQLRQLKTKSETGEISGEAMFSEEFGKDYPDYKESRFHFQVRIKPQYIQGQYVTQIWLSGNPFYPMDTNTGRKVTKCNASCVDGWWLLSMSSPYWRYVEFVDVTTYRKPYTQILHDGRQISVPPKDYDLPDGSKLSDWQNRMFVPMPFERDGETEI